MPKDDFPQQRITPPHIHHLKPNEVFVFGSNTSGRHLGGASWMAFQRFGAVMGQAEGPQGQSYAIPTDFDQLAWEMKGYPVEIGRKMWENRGLSDAVNRFLDYAAEHPEQHFLVTRVGCGNAGFRDADIAPLFRSALDMENISLPHEFVKVLRRADKIKAIKDGILQDREKLKFLFKSKYLALSDAEEARELLVHPIYGAQLRKVAIRILEGSDMESLLSGGHQLSNVDVYLRSCMTLLDYVSPHDVFGQVIKERFHGERCMKTLRRLRMEEDIENEIDEREEQETPSRLTITRDFRILLTDYQPMKEIEMEPIFKAVYLLFLHHPEGIPLKLLSDHHDELTRYYQQIKQRILNERARQSIAKLEDPTDNSIHEKCSRIKSAFEKMIGEKDAQPYIICGEAGEAKTIAIDRTLVTWDVKC